MEKRKCSKIRAGLIVFALLVFSVQPLHSASRVIAQDSAIAQTPTETPSVSKRKGLPAPALADRDGDGLSDGLQATLAVALPTDLFDVVVTFVGPDYAAVARKALGPLKVKREFTIIPGFAATMSAAQARGLSKARGVVRVEEDFAVRTMLDAARDDFGVTSVHDGLFYDGSDVGICVVDTGVDPSHEQLDGKVTVDRFVDYVNGRTDPYDDHGHGTHVSSIAAGDGTGGSVAATFKGVAPGAAIYAAKVLDAMGQGSDSDVIAGVQWCAAQAGVEIISMSLGSSLPSDGGDALSVAVNNAVTGGKVVVVAAGNSGDAPGTVGSPGAAEQAITVGAAAEWSAPGDAPNHSNGIYLAPFSSRGPTPFVEKPDILAPGVSITAARAGVSNGYVTWSGTSMATPFVAGTVALALHADSSLEPTSIKKLLVQSAHRHFASADSDWGGGVVDAAALLKSVNEASSVSSTIFPQLRRESLAVPLGGVGEYAFEIGEDALNVPVAVGITIAEGEQICLYGNDFICDLLGGWAWTPDFDAELIYVADGVETVVASSICPLQGECGAAGRQEILHFLPASDDELGTYLVRVAQFPDDPGGLRDGVVLLDISTGPAVVPETGTVNTPPLITGVPQISVDEDTLYRYEFTVTDADGDDLTLSVPVLPEWLTLEPSVSFLSGIPSNDEVGEHNVTLRVSDGTVEVDQSFTISVNNVNDPPTITSSPVTNSTEGTLYEYNFTATDDDKDILTLTAPVLPGWLTFDRSTGLLSGTPLNDDVGQHNVTLRVSDGAVDVDQAFIVTVVKTPVSGIHISDLDGSAVASRKFWKAMVTVAVHDGGHAPIAGALVSGNGGVVTCTTGSDGRCSVTFRKLSNQTQSIDFTVDEVVAGASYVAAENHDDDGDSNGTIITVSRP